MTAVDSGHASTTTDDPTVSAVVAEVDGIPMSGLLARAHDARAVVVAVHGGSTTAAYFDCPGRPSRSLLRLGVAAGYTVLALDRPGYGSSAPFAHTMSDPARRVELAYAAMDHLLADQPADAGDFLLAHSAGCSLVMGMAADPRGAQLLGLELSGTGRHHPPSTRAVLDLGGTAGQAAVREMLWQPTHLYPPELIGGAAISFPAPAYERAAVESWAERAFPALAAAVRVPVQLTLAEYELVWRSGPAALADIASLFTAAPRVVVHEQFDSGHNLSLGSTAAAYHLRVLSFVEECVVARMGREER